jgi:hypothetical protein
MTDAVATMEPVAVVYFCTECNATKVALLVNAINICTNYTAAPCKIPNTPLACPLDAFQLKVVVMLMATS